MNQSLGQLLLFGSLGVASLVTFALMGYDKWLAGRNCARLAESTLWLACVLGGWPGGLIGVIIFRHKSAKTSFLLKFASAVAIWAALAWAVWQRGATHP